MVFDPFKTSNWNMTLISDRDKGLRAANQVLGPDITRFICSFHLKCNFQMPYQMLDNQFWPIANSRTGFDFSTSMQALQVINTAVANYLAGIQCSMCVTAYYTGPYFTHKTSK